MKCRNDVYMRKIGVNKLDKSMEVDFDVQRNLPDCRKVNASKYISTEASDASYNKYAIPANQFECMNANCVNSGTLTIGNGKKVVYKVANGEDFASGVITFYVTSDVTAASVSISDTEEGTNAYTYTASVGAASQDGYKPVVVDLTQTPTAVGEGWEASEGYAYIIITLTGGASAGISSLAIFEEMEDFQSSTHVKVACLTGIDGTWDLDVAESSCFENGYDVSSRPSIEKTITGTKVTANYWRLNPMYKRGSATTGFDIVTVERTIKSADGYGVVVLEDMLKSECGFFSAMLAESPCVTEDSALEKLSIPTAVALDGGHYLLIDNGDDTVSVMFNSMYVGKKVIISYPKAVDVEEFLISTEDLLDVRTRMSYVKTRSDGNRYRFVYDHVLITSFPDALTEDDTEFAFTVSIQPDASGRYGHAYRIIGDATTGAPSV